MYLASCSYEESKKYRGRLMTIPKDEDEKAEEVQLNIISDGSDIEDIFKGGLGIAKCVTVEGAISSCPQNFKSKVFKVCYSVDDIEDIDGVIPLLVLEDGYCNMRELENICREYPSVRLIGGNLLEIDSVRIGRFDEGKEKMGSVFNGQYDAFKEVPLSSLEVQVVTSKAKSTNTVTKSKKIEVFNSLFGDELEDF